MIYRSVCSGIEAATVAWHGLGWKPESFSEIDPFPVSVLKHHYPHVPIYGDFTTAPEPTTAIDVLVGGTPCQAFSIAGKREGLDDARGNLTLEFLKLAGRVKPRWIVWENVPGVLSIDGGRTFGTVLGVLGKLGYGTAYRVLDAQFFGVPQRRRRVFVVGYLGDWRPAAAVLFERESLSRYPPTRKQERKDVAPTISARTKGGGGLGTDFDLDGGLIAPTIRAGGNLTGGHRPPGTDVDTCESLIVTHSLRAEGFDASEDGTGRGIPLTVAFSCKDYGADADRLAPTLRAMGHSGSHANAGGQVAVAFNLRGREDGAQAEVTDVASLRAASGGSSRSYVAASSVRRLTPVECERLQGFPDNYTLVTRRGKPAADGPRYKALGNSMAVPVMRWIGERIAAVDALLSH